MVHLGESKACGSDQDRENKYIEQETDADSQETSKDDKPLVRSIDTSRGIVIKSHISSVFPGGHCSGLL